MADFFGDLDPREYDVIAFSLDTTRLSRFLLFLLYIAVLILLVWSWPYLSLFWLLFAFLHLAHRFARTSDFAVYVRNCLIHHLGLVYAAILDILDALSDLTISYLGRLIDQQLRNDGRLERMLEEGDVVDVELHEYDLQAWRERIRGRMDIQGWPTDEN